MGQGHRAGSAECRVGPSRPTPGEFSPKPQAHLQKGLVLENSHALGEGAPLQGPPSKNSHPTFQGGSPLKECHTPPGNPASPQPLLWRLLYSALQKSPQDPPAPMPVAAGTIEGSVGAPGSATSSLHPQKGPAWKAIALRSWGPTSSQSWPPARVPRTEWGGKAWLLL